MSSAISSLLGGDPWTQATELHRRLAYVPGGVTFFMRHYRDEDVPL